jgi:hypothetical protein
MLTPLPWQVIRGRERGEGARTERRVNSANNLADQYSVDVYG